MQTKFAKHMKALHMLAGEVGTLGEEDGRYAEVYTKLSDALDIAEQVGLITNVEAEGEVNLFYTSKRFGEDTRQGIHLLQPNALELSRAVDDAQAKGFRKIYVHSN